jgi:hypothetical protein
MHADARHCTPMDHKLFSQDGTFAGCPAVPRPAVHRLASAVVHRLVHRRAFAAHAPNFTGASPCIGRRCTELHRGIGVHRSKGIGVHRLAVHRHASANFFHRNVGESLTT